MDDMLGKLLCQRRGVPRLSSAQLAAEMVVAGALEHDAGYAVFDGATPDGVAAAEFAGAIERARNAARPRSSRGAG